MPMPHAPAPLQPSAMAAAIAWSQAHEIDWVRDPAAAPGPGQRPYGVHHDDPPPWNRALGPLHPRGGVSGVVWQQGRELAAWGEPDRAGQTFSVAKTYLALLAGLARQRGLLPDLDEPVAARLPGIGFDAPAAGQARNDLVSWRMLMQQTSEWGGRCLGLDDQADRWRKVASDPRTASGPSRDERPASGPSGGERPASGPSGGERPASGPKGGARPLQAPGSYWEYNDVRVNQLSLALLHLWREPLPQVFQRELLQPLGGGTGFAWEAYEHAGVDVGGQRLPSVPGGTHWGGGVRISARDQTRIGQLLLDDGLLGDGRRLLPAGWFAEMSRPCAIAPFYGLCCWLNPGGVALPAASEQAVLMQGAGGHLVWVDPPLALVAVLRWVDPAAQAGFAQRLLAQRT